MGPVNIGGGEVSLLSDLGGGGAHSCACIDTAV